jgi:hypothetical protein
MPALNAGDVPITLAGETRILHPTLRAITMISSVYGGLSKAVDALVQREFAAAITVIRWGLNLTDREAKALPDQVFETGLTPDLVVPLIRYVNILANGGKPLPDDPVDSLEDESAEGNGRG